MVWVQNKFYFSSYSEDFSLIKSLEKSIPFKQILFSLGTRGFWKLGSYQ